MKIADLPNAPEWLTSAQTKNAEIDWRQGRIVWHGGVWRGGVWRGGVWHGGEWHDGEWRGGVWHGGEWHDGEWHDGEWHDGEWRGGEWRGGVWRGGVWRGGVWHGGEWHDGEWHDGEWHGGEWHDPKTHRLYYMASLLGIVFNEKGVAKAYRTTRKDGTGRHTINFTQVEGSYYEEDLPPAGTGTCVRGVHVSSAAIAHTYFGVDHAAQMWEVTFTKEDLLDCDGQKARIRGGVFRRIERPF